MGCGRSKEKYDYYDKKVNIDYVPESMRLSSVYEIIPEHDEIICRLRKTNLIEITSKPYVFLKNFRQILKFLEESQENLNKITEREGWSNTSIMSNCDFFYSNPEIFSYRIYEGIIEIRVEIIDEITNDFSIITRFNQIIHIHNGVYSYSSKISQREIINAIIMMISVYKNFIRTRHCFIRR